MFRFKKNNFKVTKLLILSVLLMSLLGLLYYTRFRIKAYDNTKIITDDKPLSVDKNGSIVYEENTLFKRYTINFNNIVNKSQWLESSDILNIYFKDRDIANQNFKSSTNTTDIYIANPKQKKNSVIKIKKFFKEGNEIYIDHSNNKKLVILISKVKNPYKYKVVLDPGHGGRDPGNISGKLLEKDCTLKICNYMYNNLMFNGCQVILTRQDDMELDRLVKNDLIKRANIANENKADIFVSIHVNAGNVKDKNFKDYMGISTYYLLNKDEKQNIKRTKLAQTIQKYAVQSDDWQNRKYLTANYSVLRNTVMPSALIECGFLTNSDDVKRITNETVLSNLGLTLIKVLWNILTIKLLRI